MKNVFFIPFLTLWVLLTLPRCTQAQQYVYISDESLRQLIRGNIGYTTYNFTDAKITTPYAGINLCNELKMISAFWKKKAKITVHDAFYTDLNFGFRQALNANIMPKPPRINIFTQLGYLGLLGYREKKWALEAGIDFRWVNLQYTRPWVARAEYCISKKIAEKRVIIMAWHNAGNVKQLAYQSVRLEFPIAQKGRLYLFGQYTKIPSFIEQYNFGLRVQNPIL